MVKSAVKVLIRTRPTANFASKNIDLNANTGEIKIFVPKDETQGVINNQTDTWTFKFENILHNASQEGIFSQVTDLLGSVIDG